MQTLDGRGFLDCSDVEAMDDGGSRTIWPSVAASPLVCVATICGEMRMIFDGKPVARITLAEIRQLVEEQA